MLCCNIMVFEAHDEVICIEKAPCWGEKRNLKILESSGGSNGPFHSAGSIVL